MAESGNDKPLFLNVGLVIPSEYRDKLWKQIDQRPGGLTLAGFLSCAVRVERWNAERTHGKLTLDGEEAALPFAGSSDIEPVPLTILHNEVDTSFRLSTTPAAQLELELIAQERELDVAAYLGYAMSTEWWNYENRGKRALIDYGPERGLFEAVLPYAGIVSPQVVSIE